VQSIEATRAKIARTRTSRRMIRKRIKIRSRIKIRIAARR